MLLAAPLLLAGAPAAHAAFYFSETDGPWDGPAVWGTGTPGPGDTAVISENDAVSIPSGGITVGNLLVIRGGSVHFNDETLTVTGNVTLGDDVGPGGLVTDLSGGQLDVAGKLELVDADVDDIDITVASGGSGHSTVLAAGGSSRWTNATLHQTGGTASFAGHTATGAALTLERVATTVTGVNTVGDLTLTAPTGSGSLTFHTPTGAATRLSVGALSASGTQTVATTWTGTPAAGVSSDLLTKTSGSFGGLTTPDDEHTTYTAGASTLSARYVVYANTTAPSVTSSNASASLATAGDTVTCAPGAWSEASTYAYAWKRDGTTIPGAASATYVVTGDDEGHSLSCAVTGTGTPVSRTATATSATTITVPAAPSVSITSAPPPTVTTTSTSVSYAAGPGTTVSRCTIDDVPITCANPLTVSGYDNGSRPTVRITGRNAAGQTVVASAAFSVRIPPALTLAAPATARGGEPVTVAITTASGVQLSCAYAGTPLTCAGESVTVPAPPAGKAFALSVTATSATGSTTATHTLTATAATPFPSPIVVPVGEAVTIPSPSFLGAGPGTNGYDWQGPLAVTWSGTFTEPSSWRLRVAAPKAPGTYRQTLTWYAEGGDLNAFTVKAVDPAKTAPKRTLGGVTSKAAPLTCPASQAGTTYTWWVNGQLVTGQTKRTLPASAVPSTGNIFCTARNPTTGFVVVLRVLLDRGARVAGFPLNRMLQVALSQPATLEVRSLRGSRRLAVTRVKAKRGTQRVPVPKAAGSFQIRVVRADGTKSRPLTIVRPA